MTKRILFSLLVMLGVLNLHQAYPSQQHELRTQQRQLFLQAETALAAESLDEFHKIAAQLAEYPLYPYLIYQELASRLDTLPKQEIDNFLQTYKNTPFAEQLRYEWLIALSQQKKWSLFATYFQAHDPPRLQCLALQGKLAQGITHLNDEIAPLWLTGKSQAKECDPVFSHWLQHSKNQDPLIWQRFLLALEEENSALANYLKRKLNNPEMKQNGEFYLKIYHRPTLLVSMQENEKPDPVLWTLGLSRLAHNHPVKAKLAWQRVHSKIKFSDEQHKKIIAHISKKLRYRDRDIAAAWFNELPQKWLDSAFSEWYAYYVLKQENWQQLKIAIEKLPEKVQLQDRWQYWYGRSLEQLGNPELAKPYYSAIAHERNYYGFLAAEKLHRQPAIKHHPLPFSHQEQLDLLALPGLQRANEFYQLHRYQEGNQEWWWLIQQLNDRQDYIAAKLAAHIGWDNVALTTSSRINFKSDLNLRFPLQHKSIIKKQSRHLQLNPSVIFAVIRQESYFRPDAISPAGAQGLMQLMPYTAKQVARNLNLPTPNSKLLTEPQLNITLGSTYLAQVRKQLDGQLIPAIASYNAGPHRIKRWLPESGMIESDIWIDSIPFKETREYVKYVITYSMIYDYLLGKHPSLRNYTEPVRALSR